MDYPLLCLIAAAICLHLVEHGYKKGRKWLSVINILFHILSFFLFARMGRTLFDLFVFFLSSSIAALLLMRKEVKDGI